MQRRPIGLIQIAVLLILSAASVWAQPPEVLWTRTYGGSGNEAYFGADVHQTSDGGYIIAGSTSSYGAGSYDAWVIKTDANGNSLWSHTFGSSGSDYAYSVQQTTDGGYIIGGCYNWSYGSGDLWLIKTDTNGHEVWSSTFHRSVSNDVGFVQQTTDGGYVLFSSSGSYYIPGQYDWWLIKTDENGDSLWSRTYGGEGTEWAETVHQTQDGGYILSGATNSFPFTPPPNMAHYWLLKTDANGDSLWSHLYTNEGYDIGRGSQQTSDEGYVFVGGTSPSPSGAEDMWLIKTDVNGDIEWDRTFGGSGDDYGYRVLQTEDGGYIVVGVTSSYGAGGYDMWLIKTDANGDSLWSRTAGGSGDESGFGIDQTGDGGYVAVGRTNSFGAGGDDLCLVRLGFVGAPPMLSINLTPQNPPIVIPDSGGSFEYNITVSNDTSYWQTFNAWCSVEIPSGMEYPVLGPVTLTFAPGYSLTRLRTQAVPSIAPAGSYTYWGYVGTPPWIIVDCDSFSFVKEGAASDWPGLDGWLCLGEPFPGEEPLLDAVPRSTSSTLHPCRPNPFNPTTAISFELQAAGRVGLKVYDTVGRLVVTLVDGWRDAGDHQITFDASELPTGIYFAKLSAGDYTQVQKLILLK